MPTEAEDRLHLAQWFSAGFPIGSFAYSHGLETAMAAGQVADAAALETWIADALDYGAGLADAVLLIAARRAEDAAEITDIALALAPSAERHRESVELGRAFADMATATGTPVAPAPFPVAVGVAARRLCLPDQEVAGQYLQAYAAAMVSAAVRFIPLGQSEGQAVLSRLQPTIAARAQQATTLQVEDIATAAFGSDLAAMAHETLQPRIFRT